MKDLRVKLISLPNMGSWFIYDQFILPYGLGILANFLKEKNYRVTLDDISIKIEDNHRKFLFPSMQRIDIDMLQPNNSRVIDYLSNNNYNDDNNKKIGRLAEQLISVASCEGYDVIGISVFSYLQILPALLLSKKLKSMSAVKIVLGGSYITLNGEEIFSSYPFIDYIIIGDGQIPFIRLLEHLEGRIPIENVPSLIYRHNGSIRHNTREFLSIEELSIPNFSDLPLEIYRSDKRNKQVILPYQVTRGCPYNCSFCNMKFITPSVELKSHEKVTREIKIMRERYKSNAFNFRDEAMNYSYEYLDEFCDNLVENNLNIQWSMCVRPDNLDMPILRKMKKAGCVFLWFGLESGSNRILKNINKGFTIEQASGVLKNAYELGIVNNVFLITGYPYEREEDIDETINFIKTHSKYITSHPALIRLHIDRGAPLYTYPEKFGIENLRIINKLGLIYTFDEINGLKGKDKVKQQFHSYRKVLKACFKYIDQRTIRINVLPFWIYLLMRDKSHWSWYVRLLRRLLRCLKRKKYERLQG